MFTCVLFDIVRRIHCDFDVIVNSIYIVIKTVNDRMISADCLEIGVTDGRYISCVDYGRLQSS